MTDKYDQVKKNYDSVSTSLHNAYNPIEEYTDIVTEFENKLPAKGSILTVGAIGSETEHFINKGFRVTNIDISPNMLATIQQSSPQTTLVEGNIKNAHFPEKFDGVLAIRSLIHIPTQDLPDALTTIKKYLNDDGVFTAVFFTTDQTEPVEEEFPDSLSENQTLYYRVLYPKEYLMWVYENVLGKVDSMTDCIDKDGDTGVAITIVK